MLQTLPMKYVKLYVEQLRQQKENGILQVVQQVINTVLLSCQNSELQGQGVKLVIGSIVGICLGAQY